MSARRSALLLTGIGFALAVLAACQSTRAIPQYSESQRDKAAAVNLQLGVGYLQQGNLALAKTKLERAQIEDPHNADIHSTLGLLDERLGKDKEADKEYRTALSLKPQDPDLLNSYAVYLCSHGRAVEGVHNFEQAAGNPLYRSPWVAYTNAGVCLAQAHRENDAAEMLVRALRSNPAYAAAVFQASDLDFSQQKYAAARLRLDFFLSNNPATPDLLLLGWRIAQAQNDAAAAARYAQRLAKEFPGSEQSRSLSTSQANPG
ncbi:MAG TPA: type IV pilus biogenesis/stability protein PilW [Steroidobacteraceae bacterium]|jgi:type IV pilus assembly protein PilF